MDASSSSTAGANSKYDVFLSFRGEDTRKNLISHLYNALTNKGIRTFRDDRSLEKGKTIKEELFSAIESSRLSVVVLSENYASSGWCLDELAKIIECKIQHKQIVIPVLYCVDEMGKCRIVNRFAEAFAKRDEAVDEEYWRKALTEEIESGWDISKAVEQYGNEADCIEQIVKEVASKLKEGEVKIGDLLISCGTEALTSLSRDPLQRVIRQYAFFFCSPKYST